VDTLLGSIVVAVNPATSDDDIARPQWRAIRPLVLGRNRAPIYAPCRGIHSSVAGQDGSDYR
jgi:hypothetical protein